MVEAAGELIAENARFNKWVPEETKFVLGRSVESGRAGEGSRGGSIDCVEPLPIGEQRTRRCEMSSTHRAAMCSARRVAQESRI